jgi:hypothetical protein
MRNKIDWFSFNLPKFISYIKELSDDFIKNVKIVNSLSLFNRGFPNKDNYYHFTLDIPSMSVELHVCHIFKSKSCYIQELNTSNIKLSMINISIKQYNEILKSLTKIDNHYISHRKEYDNNRIDVLRNIAKAIQGNKQGVTKA